MPMIGKTLGSFECTALLGKGGMGEVYSSKNQKLGRDVAIKVLPEEFAKDTDRVARFQREAKLLAALNHPNIAAIYGLEESDGTHFLVLELIEGDTLASRIKSGPVPVEEALKLALQIAEALEAAHEKGVIHRDLKPANIKVTPDGKVKVLDFGLAKAYAGDSESMNLSNSPTLSDMATQQGVILGTAAYMSPEQARGKPVDKRTDIWAFGCVLYEMLTGQAAFQGEDVTEILAAVVKSGVNLDLLPAKWDLAIEHCQRALEFDPHYYLAHQCIGFTYLEAGNLDKAIEACEAAGKAVGQSQWALAIPGVAYAKAGKVEEAKKLLEELHTLSNNTYVSPAAFTWMYCNLGEIEKGMEWFEKAIDQQDLLILASYLFPICDPLRSHPRYKALLRKMNLEP